MSLPQTGLMLSLINCVVARYFHPISTRDPSRANSKPTHVSPRRQCMKLGSAAEIQRLVRCVAAVDESAAVRVCGPWHAVPGSKITPGNDIFPICLAITTWSGHKVQPLALCDIM